MAGDDVATFRKDLTEIINERQQVSYNELSDMAFSRGVEEARLKDCLSELERDKTIASRSSGGILTYYILNGADEIRKVLIVEDDRNINKLMALSIGKGFDVRQIYDGGEAIQAVRKDHPDLVVLDLMLPNKDGLDICQTIKSDPAIKDTIVIIVSAMDPTSNRFQGIKYGADYYIKKPFDPHEIRSLVTIFLKKKGKRFDPLIDLPDEERISSQLEHSIKQGGQYSIGTLKIAGLGTFAEKFDKRAAMAILRLVSQLLQDSVKSQSGNAFVGFLNTTDFVVAGPRDGLDRVVDEVKEEFSAVLPFIMQDAGYKQINLDVDALFESREAPKLYLTFTESEKEQLKERRNEVLRDKGVEPTVTPGSYSYSELQKIFGSDDLDVVITRDDTGVKLQVGKANTEKAAK